MKRTSLVVPALVVAGAFGFLFTAHVPAHAADAPAAAATTAKPAHKVVHKAGAKAATTKSAALASIDVQVAKVDKSKPDWRTTLSKPEMMTFDDKKTYFAHMLTNKGPILIKLLPQVAPMHVTNFIFLSRLGFYDGLSFHRVIPGFMAQGGDPVGNGTGGPGYQFGGEFDPGTTFDQPGRLAMANAGPGTDGSQFFITFVPTAHLNGKHTIFGQAVVDATLKKLEDAGSPGAGTPKEPLKIEKVTIEVK